MDPDKALAVFRDFADDPVETRWLRALGEYMTILDVNDDIAKVVSESGSTCLVNPVEGWCD